MKANLRGWAIGSAAVTAVMIIGIIDWITGYELDLAVFYFVPVAAVAWFSGLGASVRISVFSAIVWLMADKLSGHAHSSVFYAAWNTMILLVSLLAIAWPVARIRQLLDSERRMVEELRRAIAEVKVLESFLPICCQCKKIRDQDGNWQQLEVYITGHSNTQFSHGYCPECAEKSMLEAGLARKNMKSSG
jgi:hypothetical protein